MPEELQHPLPPGTVVTVYPEEEGEGPYQLVIRRATYQDPFGLEEGEQPQLRGYIGTQLGTSVVTGCRLEWIGPMDGPKFQQHWHMAQLKKAQRSAEYALEELAKLGVDIKDLAFGNVAVRNFTCHGNSAPAYSCMSPNDQSGLYLKVAPDKSEFAKDSP